MMAGAPLATIAICTHDRSGSVAACLASLAAQAAQAGFPVLLVDSASSPAEAEALRAIASASGAELVRCAEAGLSRARNLAASQAQGQWIVYVDDDILAFPDWAEELAACLRAAPDDVVAIGGQVRALWPMDVRHGHIGQRWKQLLSCTDQPGSGPVPGFNVFGANLAVRRAALQAVGGFPTRLGRIGKRLISGEESFVIERLRQEGLRVRYDARFGVDHCISPERMTVPWVRQRAYWEGVSRIRIHQELGKPLPASLNPVKLAASLPLLMGLGAVSPEFAIRCAMAWGSLAALLSIA
ncbi:glycosyltransferase family 2 protein [Camelimonas sp. ID_303_24]